MGKNSKRKTPCIFHNARGFQTLSLTLKIIIEKKYWQQDKRYATFGFSSEDFFIFTGAKVSTF